MAFKYTQAEKDAHLMMKNLIKKPTRLKASDFEIGNIVLYTYRAKGEQNPYDATPLTLILGRNRKYTYGINWNWVPPILRRGLINMVLSMNKNNIARGKPLKIPKKLVKQIFRNGVPAFRKYLNNRISPKGVLLPHTQYSRVINLRAENFIGISSDDAWKIAVKKMKINKKKRR